jgi:hypothetical protein
LPTSPFGSGAYGVGSVVVSTVEVIVGVVTDGELPHPASSAVKANEATSRRTRIVRW